MSVLRVNQAENILAQLRMVLVIWKEKKKASVIIAF